MKKTHKKHKFIYFIVFVFIVAIAAVAGWYFHHTKVAVLDPKGPIALKEYHLFIFAILLSLLVVIPVYVLLISFAWKYRESNKNAKYSPELDGNKIAETIWWLIPSALIGVLAVIAWNSSHTLNPYTPIQSNTKPMLIQVVALDWKWLFIYPQENIATVNFIQIPTQTPINFEITSDTVMNSFWIPQLGGQIYAMPGMSTELNLLASTNGNFYGSSANISGEGFAGMNFTTKATSAADFYEWVNQVKQSPSTLNLAAYNTLARPSEYNKAAIYSSAQYGLYNSIIDKYMLPPSPVKSPSSSPSTISNMPEMEMQ